MTSEIERISQLVLDEVDELLEDTEKIPLQTVLRLNLSVQRELARGLNRLIDHVNVQNNRISASEKEIKELVSNSIIGWVKKNPKLSIVYIVLFLLATDIAVNQLSAVDSMSVLGAILKKWLGL